MKKKILYIVMILIILVFSGNMWAKEIRKTSIIDLRTHQKVTVVTGEILVKFKPAVKKKDIDRINRDFRVQIKEKLRGKNIYCLKIHPSKTINEMVEKYRRNPNVEFAEPNYIISAFAVPPPDDTYYLSDDQWGIEQIRAPQAWNIETGTKSVVIAILDTGVDHDHIDLDGNMWTDDNDCHGYDYVNKDDNPDDDNIDSHGTRCAGIAAAVTDNNEGIAGVSWESEIMAVKVLNQNGEGEVKWVYDGIYYAADNRAKIISMSLGTEYGSPQIETWREAVNYAYSKGCLLVAASGNDNKRYVAYPAAYEKVIAVGASDDNDNRCNFSNYGPELDVVAPGSGILSTVWEGMGRVEFNNNYDYEWGTSMSVPFVSGLAALIWSHNPDLTNSGVRDVIGSSADDIPPGGKDKYTGYGRINAERALALAIPLPEEVVYGIMNFPNPFRPAPGVPQTTICFTTKDLVREKSIDIYNLAGELVHKAPGTGITCTGIDPSHRHVYKYNWNGRNDYGERVASGIYIYVVNADGSKKAGKLAIIK